MPEALKVEAQFNRANISNKDFTEAEDYLRAYGDHLPETLRRAVLVSAIVTYSRPFTSNDGGTEGLATGTMTGNPKRILSNKEFMLHEKILRLRNEAVAHSDYDRRPTRFVEKVGTGFLTRSKPFDVLSERISIATFLAMCTKMKNHCTDMLFTLSRDLGQEGDMPNPRGLNPMPENARPRLAFIRNISNRRHTPTKLAKKMTPSQLADAQKLAREWMEERKNR